MIQMTNSIEEYMKSRIKIIEEEINGFDNTFTQMSRNMLAQRINIFYHIERSNSEYTLVELDQFVEISNSNYGNKYKVIPNLELVGYDRIGIHKEEWLNTGKEGLCKCLVTLPILGHKEERHTDRMIRFLSNTPYSSAFEYMRITNYTVEIYANRDMIDAIYEQELSYENIMYLTIVKKGFVYNVEELKNLADIDVETIVSDCTEHDYTVPKEFVEKKYMMY